MLENIKTILYIIYASLMLLITLFNFLLGKHKVKKAKGKTEEVKEDLNQTNSLIDGLKATAEILGDFLLESMEVAEKSGMTGIAKKAYVISMVIQKCVELNIDYNSIKDLVSSKIESLIGFSHLVNPRIEKKGEENGNNSEGERPTQRFE